MDVSNASLYDGGSAVAEASLMAIRAHRKSKSQRILVPATLNPAYRKVPWRPPATRACASRELPCPKGGQLSVASLEKYKPARTSPRS